ncbi:bifunctional indole-3-glycerol phosphate synthase/phosphoribosylanthranilate isomerase, partial [Vibrio cyclitrophicus]
CEMAKSLELNAIQLHGDEDEAFVADLREQLDDSTEIWKAYGVMDEVPSFVGNVDRHLLDSKVGTQSGGTGKAFD